VTGQYTEVERSQHLTQADHSIFRRSYVTQTSSVNRQGAFLGRAPDYTVVEYFQGLETFREAGAPPSLPSAMRVELEQNPEVVTLKKREAAARHPHEAAVAKSE
jgi:hypothetical protein